MKHGRSLSGMGICSTPLPLLVSSYKQNLHSWKEIKTHANVEINNILKKTFSAKVSDPISGLLTSFLTYLRPAVRIGWCRHSDGDGDLL